MESRKRPRLKGYDYHWAGWYFVTVCTPGKKNLLGSVVGADVLIGSKLLLSDLGQMVYDVIASMPNVDKYVIMPNHVHMILRIELNKNGPMRTSAPTHSLPQIIRYFKRSVTQAYGESIWQRSYHDHIIRNEADYLRIWEYVDTNPVKWSKDCCFTCETM